MNLSRKWLNEFVDGVSVSDIHVNFVDQIVKIFAIMFLKADLVLEQMEAMVNMLLSEKIWLEFYQIM